MTDKELHKLLNDKFDGLEIKLPTDDWDEIAEKLPQQRSAMFFVWRTAAAAAIIAILTLMGIHIYKGNQQIDNFTPDQLIAKNDSAVNGPTKTTDSLTEIVVTHDSNNEKTPTLNSNKDTHIASQTTTQVAPQTISTPATKTTADKLLVADRSTTHKQDKTHQATTSNSSAATIPQNTVGKEATTATTTSQNSSQLYTEFTKATTPVENDSVKKSTNNSPNITAEEAEQILNQQNQTLLANLDQQNTTFKDKKYKISKSDTYCNLGLSASLNANDRVGTQESAANAPISFVNHIKGGPLHVRPHADSKLSYDLPFSIGLQIGVPVTRRLSFHTGLTYTYLHSVQTNYTDSASIASVYNFGIHYLGIPLKASYKFIDHPIFNVYIDLGGSMEKGFQRRTITLYNEGDNQRVGSYAQKSIVPGVQWSLNADIGLAVNLYKGLQFYLEPGVSWFIPNTRNPQPPSTRTERPVFFTLTSGLRFNFLK